MKSTTLSLVAATTILGMFSSADANALDDAFAKGKISGDITITYEARDQDKELNNYYNDSAYSVGSAELIYQTGVLNNFSATIGFRGYGVLYEDDKTVGGGYGLGIGDASSRFFDINGESIVVPTNLYVAYDTDNLHVKVGRHELNTEWFDEHHDGISIYANPNEKSELELIWSSKHNRLWARELFYGGTIEGVMGTINSEGGGVYKAGYTYNLLDSLKAKAYVMEAPENYSVYGGKATFSAKAEDVSYGGYLHYMQTNEKIKPHDGELFDVNAYVGFSDVTIGLGYIETGKYGGWGSAVNGGETVDPFEEGDQTYAINSRTPYITLSTTVAGVSLYGIYGATTYGLEDYEKDEFCVWAGYNITDKLSLGAILTITNEDENDPNTTDMIQTSATLVYKF